MENNVIIACDFATKDDLYNFLKPFEGLNPYLKIGMELFYACGPEMVKELKDKGFKIFLDLKLCDIPNTVEKAMRNLAKLGVDITNVHASGGIKMMEAAKRGLAGSNTKLIAVTILTSLDDTALSQELDINKTVKEVVYDYAKNAKKAGLDGIVCSPLEAGIAKELGLISVTPGIRLAGDQKGDQKRVTTPHDAYNLGSTYIVVGRSITGSENPVEQYLKCVKEFGNEWFYKRSSKTTG